MDTDGDEWPRKNTKIAKKMRLSLYSSIALLVLSVLQIALGETASPEKGKLLAGGGTESRGGQTW